MRKLAILIVGWLSLLPAIAQQPTPVLPLTTPNPAYNLPTGGTTWNVTTPVQFQNAITSSVPGDVIVLEHGVEFWQSALSNCTPANHLIDGSDIVAHFLFPAKSNPLNKDIYIISDEHALMPPAGTRVGPSNGRNDLPNMYTISTHDSSPAMCFPSGSNHWKFWDGEVTTKSTFATGTDNMAGYSYGLIWEVGAGYTGWRTMNATTGSNIDTENATFMVQTPIAQIDHCDVYSMAANTTGTINCVGYLTHWVSGGTTQAMFTYQGLFNQAPDITVNSVTASDDTHVAINITTGSSPLGLHELVLITGANMVYGGNSWTSYSGPTENAPMVNQAFNVTGGPTVSSISPTVGVINTTNETVTINTTGTHFVNGTTHCTLGYGVNVSSVTVNAASGSNAATLVIGSIWTGATSGPRTVSCVTGTEVAQLYLGFWLTNNASRYICGSVPDRGAPGTSVNVTVTGCGSPGTAWNSGTTFDAADGAGDITITGVSVTNSHTATMTLNIPASTDIGASDIGFGHMYIHGYDGNIITNPTTGVVSTSGQYDVGTAVVLDAKNAFIVDSEISSIHSDKNFLPESHGIAFYQGNGPCLIENNEISSMTEDVFSGGTYDYRSSSPSLPQDCTLTGNYHYKPQIWIPLSNGNFNHGVQAFWGEKNGLELKSGKRWLVQNSIINGTWCSDQCNDSILLEPRVASAPDPQGSTETVVEDITIQNISEYNVTAGVVSDETDYDSIPSIGPDTTDGTMWGGDLQRATIYNLQTILIDPTDPGGYCPSGCFPLVGHHLGQLLQNISFNHVTATPRYNAPSGSSCQGTGWLNGIYWNHQIANVTSYNAWTTDSVLCGVMTGDGGYPGTPEQLFMGDPSTGTYNQPRRFSGNVMFDQGCGSTCPTYLSWGSTQNVAYSPALTFSNPASGNWALVTPNWVPYTNDGTQAGVNETTLSTAVQYVVSGIPTSSLQILTTSLPNGTVNIVYSSTMSANGGVLPYTWSIASGSLPTGLSLNPSTGAITGLPTVAGVYNFVAQVNDSASNVATQPLAITIGAGAPSITTSALPNGTTGVPYSYALSATGGVPPYTYSLVGVAVLPTGLSLSSGGLISGTPTAAGTSLTTFRATDSVLVGSAPKFLPITINSGSTLQITTTSVPNGTVGIPYSFQFAATGGTAPYTWSVIAGSLPPGLNLSTTGLLVGTPSQAGNYSYTVQVQDSSTPTPQTVSAPFSQTISPLVLGITQIQSAQTLSGQTLK